MGSGHKLCRSDTDPHFFSLRWLLPLIRTPLSWISSVPCVSTVTATLEYFPASTHSVRNASRSTAFSQPPTRRHPSIAQSVSTRATFPPRVLKASLRICTFRTSRRFKLAHNPHPNVTSVPMMFLPSAIARSAAASCVISAVRLTTARE